jgi:hypothetical protein
MVRQQKVRRSDGKIFNSAIEAGKAHGSKKGSFIDHVCRGERLKAYGFGWERVVEDDLPTEKWRVWQDCLISDKGNGRTKHGKPIDVKPSRKGYLNFERKINGRRKTIHMARAVLEAFVGPPLTSEHEADHINGDVSNNNVENLRWLTKVENVQEMWKRRRRKIIT